jgi:hypothetical protein
LRVLKQSKATKNIPVVVLSSLPQSNEARLKKEGATAYFDKSTSALDGESDSIVLIVQKILDGDSPAPLTSSPRVGTPLHRK